MELIFLKTKFWKIPCILCCQSLELLLEKLVRQLISILVLLTLSVIEVGNLVERFLRNLSIFGMNVRRILWHSQVWTISNRKLIDICLKHSFYTVSFISNLHPIQFIFIHFFSFLFSWWSCFDPLGLFGVL